MKNLKCMGFRTKKFWFKARFSYLWVLWPWTSHLTSLTSDSSAKRDNNVCFLSVTVHVTWEDVCAWPMAGAVPLPHPQGITSHAAILLILCDQRTLSRTGSAGRAGRVEGLILLYGKGGRARRTFQAEGPGSTKTGHPHTSFSFRPLPA